MGIFLIQVLVKKGNTEKIKSYQSREQRRREEYTYRTLYGTSIIPGRVAIWRTCRSTGIRSGDNSKDMLFFF
jgi:hypothetical protein